MTITIHQGDCREVLATLPEGSVNCCVTSPPYWGLRDYGVDSQIGLEKTPGEFVTQMVAVFREVRRVLRDDGTLWLNLGDSYATGTKASRSPTSTTGPDVPAGWAGRSQPVRCGTPAGIKTKDLVGIPWMVAFALRADGWYLRQDIIWHKPNPMPESVTDRCTKAHEYIFLLSKSDRYYFNQDAIAEPVKPESIVRAESGVSFGGTNLCPDTRLQSGKEWKPKAVGANSRINKSRDPAHESEFNGKNRSQDDQSSARRMLLNTKKRREESGEHDNCFGVDRNKRSVWNVATHAYKGAHFATFPPKLIEPCVLAGCPEGGTVLDPFFGSGTTGEVAGKNGCHCIGIELNPDYVKLAKRRNQQRSLLGA